MSAIMGRDAPIRKQVCLVNGRDSQAGATFNGCGRDAPKTWPVVIWGLTGCVTSCSKHDRTIRGQL